MDVSTARTSESISKIMLRACARSLLCAALLVAMRAAPVRAESENEPIGLAQPVAAFEKVIAQGGTLVGQMPDRACTLRIRPMIFRGPHGTRYTYTLELTFKDHDPRFGLVRLDPYLGFPSQVRASDHERIVLERLTMGIQHAELDITLGEDSTIRRIRGRTYGWPRFVSFQRIDATFGAPRAQRFERLHVSER